MKILSLFGFLMLLHVSVMADTARTREIEDDLGNILRTTTRQDADGKWSRVWELIQKGGQPGIVHIWKEADATVDATRHEFLNFESARASGNVTYIRRDSLRLGCPAIKAFHFENGVLDIFGEMMATGAYDLFQFQLTKEGWIWSKWGRPRSHFSGNAGPEPVGRWLGPGKWKLSAKNPEGRPKVPALVVEVTGFDDELKPQPVIKTLSENASGDDSSSQGNPSPRK